MKGGEKVRRLLITLVAVVVLAMAIAPVSAVSAVNYTVATPVITKCSFFGATTTNSVWTLPLTSKAPDLVTVTPNLKATIKISHVTVTLSCLHRTWNGNWDMKISGFSGLTVGTTYLVMYYCDPWPGTGGRELARFTYTERIGRNGLSTTFSMDTPIPVTTDENVASGGGKIWIIPESDYAGEEMIVWNPANYLFETSLVNLQ